jgi:hypothetical protein
MNRAHDATVLSVGGGVVGFLGAVILGIALLPSPAAATAIGSPSANPLQLLNHPTPQFSRVEESSGILLAQPCPSPGPLGCSESDQEDAPGGDGDGDGDIGTD